MPNLNATFDKVVGGTEAVPYSWPWQIVWCEAFGSSCSLECGGTVVGTGWVQTAGHCVYGSTNKPQNFKVKTGVFQENLNNETGEVVHTVKAIHLHPKYKPNPVPEWDIALIELGEPITYTDHIQPICLPLSDTTQIAPPNTAWGTGWGTTTEGGNIAKKLRQVNVPYVDYTTCGNEYGKDIMQQVMVCAGVQGKDTCQGDSGGPLQQVNANGFWFQYGITSWGEGCAEKGYPGIYSRVSAYCDFIATTTNNDVTCKDPNTYAGM
jgi:secreted trypsin-like serine protease